MKTHNLIYEIQFLRSISIFLVLLFHFDVFLFKGGFLGVDIFFTISGYLITSIILTSKKFSLINFYYKRGKRILPSLYLIILLSLVAGYYILSPIHFERLINSSKFSLVALSNFFFYQEAGYFDYNKFFKPLLHTWSLAVEIQYYIIWPIILLIIRKIFKINLFIPVLLILSLSLLSSYLYSSRTDGFFYFTGFRLFEFCIGSLTFLVLKKRKFRNDYLFFLGLILIFFSSTFYNNNLDFPSIYALLPCLGAALIILFQIPKKLIFIKNNFFINYTAKISYTLYLVHWPILVFYRYEKIDFITLPEKIVLLIISYFVSVVIYEIYEKKIRYPFKLKTKEIYFFSIVFFSIVICFSPFLENFNKTRTSKEFKNNYIIQSVFEGRKTKNEIENQILLEAKKEGSFSNTQNLNNIVILGDSHAFDLYLAIKSLKKQNKINRYVYQNFEYMYCFKKKTLQDNVIETINYKIFKRKNSCSIALNNFETEYIRNSKILILSNRWPRGIDYNKVLNYFHKSNQNLIIVSNGHRFYDVPTLYFKKKDNINLYAKNLLTDKDILIENFDILKNKFNVKFFDKSKINCNPNCTLLLNNILLYSDKDHWSFDGMNYFGQKLEEYEFFSLIK